MTSTKTRTAIQPPNRDNDPVIRLIDSAFEYLDDVGEVPTYFGKIADVILGFIEARKTHFTIHTLWDALSGAYASLDKLLERDTRNRLTDKVKAVRDTVRFPDGTRREVKRYIALDGCVYPVSKVIERGLADKLSQARTLTQLDNATLDFIRRTVDDYNSFMANQARIRGQVTGDYGLSDRGELVKIRPDAPDLPALITTEEMALRLGVSLPDRLSQGDDNGDDN